MSALQLASFPNTPLSLGLLCDFVSQFPPFDRLEFRQMTLTLQFQLEAQCHIIAGANDRIVGYLGWIPTSLPIAERWLTSDDPLIADPASTEAVVLTVFAAANPAMARPMVRRFKEINAGRHGFWRREFTGKRAAMKRAIRKRT